MFRSYANAGVSAGASSSSGASPSAGVSAPGGWHPTVLYMLALVVAEVLVAGWLSRHLLG